jgi:hypothetical protein
MKEINIDWHHQLFTKPGGFSQSGCMDGKDGFAANGGHTVIDPIFQELKQSWACDGCHITFGKNPVNNVFFSLIGL